MDCCNHQCEACHKHKERTPEEYKRLIHRLSRITKELLASHIRTCVAEDIRAGHDEAIDELVQTLQKLMK